MGEKGNEAGAETAGLRGEELTELLELLRSERWERLRDRLGQLADDQPPRAI